MGPKPAVEKVKKPILTVREKIHHSPWEERATSVILTMDHEGTLFLFSRFYGAEGEVLSASQWSKWSRAFSGTAWNINTTTTTFHFPQVVPAISCSSLLCTSKLSPLPLPLLPDVEGSPQDATNPFLPTSWTRTQSIQCGEHILTPEVMFSHNGMYTTKKSRKYHLAVSFHSPHPIL